MAIAEKWTGQHLPPQALCSSLPKSHWPPFIPMTSATLLPTTKASYTLFPLTEMLFQPFSAWLISFIL